MPALFTIGCDPELMLIDKDGNLKSSIPVIPGSKHNPQKLKHGAVLSDNVNLEFNTEPAKNAKGFINSIGAVLNECVKIVGKDYKLKVQASANFPESELQDPRTQEFGCEPDFDAWTISVNSIEEGAAVKSFRSAGGHIHIGGTNKSKFLLEPSGEGKLRMIKAMDLFVGIPSVIMDNDPTSKARRKLYGKAGCHRPKSYGVEYRAVGNFWVNSPILVKLMYNLTELAVKICLQNKEADIIKQIGQSNIVDIINNSKIKEAINVFDKILTNYMPKPLVQEIKKLSAMHFNFYQEWKL